MKIQYCLILKNRIWTLALEPEPIVDDTSFNFNYIGSLRNNESPETVWDQHRIRRNKRIDAITEEEKKISVITLRVS